MREPPTFEDVDPARLSLSELTALHEALGRWLEEALGAPPADAPGDDLYARVYVAAAELSKERVLRQQGELRGRG
jgi:hypothetical protein